MKVFSAILVPRDESKTSSRRLGCAAWLASRLGSSLHVLNVGAPLPPGDMLTTLGVPETYRPLLSLHQAQGEPRRAILDATQRHGIDLIVLTALGEAEPGEAAAAPAGPRGPVADAARGIIEATGVPVLLLPPGYREVLPWRSALVPISGEAATDASLSVALRLADALDLTVTIAHVAAGATPKRSRTGPNHSDQPHHECPQLLEELIARACPMCTLAEQNRISDVKLVSGDIACELQTMIDQERVSLLVVGWHGTFMAGHALVVKSMLRHVSCPVLLVKPGLPSGSRLKVGELFS